MEIINSEQNQWIKKLRLLQKKKHREETGQLVIEGIRFCEEAIIHGADITTFFISESLLEHSFSKRLLVEFPKKVLVVKDSILEKNLKTVNPQGIAAIVHKPHWKREKVLEGGLIVVVDGVQDPGNLGTILRTALGAGVDGVFCLKGTVDLYNDKTLRSTMGGIFNLPVFVEEDIPRFLKDIKENSFQIVMADPKGQYYYYNCPYERKVALVLGSEGQGPISIQEGDVEIKIPLSPKAESLNVAVAGGIIMYEVIRQRATSSKNSNG